MDQKRRQWLYRSAQITNDRRRRHFAIELRKHPTQAEAALYKALPTDRTADHRWRHQYVVDRYIVGFAQPASRLIVEVDGAFRNQPRQRQREEARDERLREQGWHVVRYAEEEVLKDADRLAKDLQARAKSLNEAPSGR